MAEINAGQMVQDVRLAINGTVPVEHFGRLGGIVPRAGRDSGNALAKRRNSKKRTTNKNRRALWKKSSIISPENIVCKKPTLMNDNHMHYCPGCSHGVVHKLIAEVIEEMGTGGESHRRKPRRLRRVCL